MTTHAQIAGRPGREAPAVREQEHARELAGRLAARGLLTLAAPLGSPAGAMSVATQCVDVHPSVERVVVLLPLPHDSDELFWHWRRPFPQRQWVGTYWFQPFSPAGDYDAAADKVAAAIDADVLRRGDGDEGRAPVGQQIGEAVEREVLDSIGRPLHKLVYRQVVALDAAQRSVEDPALLRRLYEIDHLAMRTLRGLERIAVLGGATARQLPEPMPLPTAMMQAAAQVEHYSRVRTPPPGFDVELPRDVAPEVTLLLAELIENATRFSPLDTEVVVAAEAVPSAGLRIEITDQGLSMPQDQLTALNRLLAAPDSADLREQIIDKRIGLLVVARLAERHGMRVALHPRHGAGTLAVVELPESLLRWAQLPLLPPEPAARVIQGVLEPESSDPVESAEPIRAADVLVPRLRTRPAVEAGPVSPGPAQSEPAPETDSAGEAPPLPQRTAAHRRDGSRLAVSGPNSIIGPAATAGAAVGAAAAFLQGVHEPATPAADQTIDQAEDGQPPLAPPN